MGNGGGRAWGAGWGARQCLGWRWSWAWHEGRMSKGPEWGTSCLLVTVNCMHEKQLFCTFWSHKILQETFANNKSTRTELNDFRTCCTSCNNAFFQDLLNQPKIHSKNRNDDDSWTGVWSGVSLEGKDMVRGNMSTWGELFAKVELKTVMSLPTFKGDGSTVL